MFPRSVSKIPSRESWPSFSCSNLARCLCHSSGRRSLVEGFKSSSGRKSREDFSAAPAVAEPGILGAAPATLVTAAAAPVAAINSRLLIICFPFLLLDMLLCGTLLTHFPSAGKHEEVAAALLVQNEVRDRGVARWGIAAIRGAKAALLAVKMDAYEWACVISNCIACGCGSAAGIYWVGAGGRE